MPGVIIWIVAFIGFILGTCHAITSDVESKRRYAFMIATASLAFMVLLLAVGR